MGAPGRANGRPRARQCAPGCALGVTGRAKVRPCARQGAPRAPRCALGCARARQGAPLGAPERATVRHWARQVALALTRTRARAFAPSARGDTGNLQFSISPKVHCTSQDCTACNIGTAQRECAPHIATAHQWRTTHCVAERGTPLMCDRDVRCPLPLCGARRLAVPFCDVQCTLGDLRAGEDC